MKIAMPDFTHEIRWGRETGKFICGVDEVGRGPLAGTVVAAVALLPRSCPDSLLACLRDSKKLSEKARTRIASDLKPHCLYALGDASVAEIDTLNILQASLLAMRRAVEKLINQGVALDGALVDGNRLPDLPCAAEAIVKGDDASLSIAAASILAKTYRDALMCDLARDFPAYGWDRNAGYGTAQHLAALRTHGPTPWHRQSFAPVARCQEAM